MARLSHLIKSTYGINCGINQNARKALRTENSFFFPLNYSVKFWKDRLLNGPVTDNPAGFTKAP